MKHHDTPPPNLASLRVRVTNAATAQSLPMGRVQRYVGVAVTVEILGAEHDPAQPAELDSLTALGPPRPDPVPCITIRWQLAQKVHACTDPLDGMTPNDRARDLPEILILAALVTDDHLPSVSLACRAVFAGTSPAPSRKRPRPSGPSSDRWIRPWRPLPRTL